MKTSVIHPAMTGAIIANRRFGAQAKRAGISLDSAGGTEARATLRVLACTNRLFGLAAAGEPGTGTGNNPMAGYCVRLKSEYIFRRPT